MLDLQEDRSAQKHVYLQEKTSPEDDVMTGGCGDGARGNKA